MLLKILLVQLITLSFIVKKWMTLLLLPILIYTSTSILYLLEKKVKKQLRLYFHILTNNHQIFSYKNYV